MEQQQERVVLNEYDIRLIRQLVRSINPRERTERWSDEECVDVLLRWLDANYADIIRLGRR